MPTFLQLCRMRSNRDMLQLKARPYVPQKLAACIDPICILQCRAHASVHGDEFPFRHCKTVTHAEKAVEHVGQRKVRPELLLFEGVLGLPEALRPECDVPLLQLLLEALHRVTCG